MFQQFVLKDTKIENIKIKILTYLQIKFESALLILQPWYTYKSEYLREFETEFKNILECESGAHMGSIIEKNQRSTISCYCTFKEGYPE